MESIIEDSQPSYMNEKNSTDISEIKKLEEDNAQNPSTDSTFDEDSGGSTDSLQANSGQTPTKKPRSKKFKVKEEFLSEEEESRLEGSPADKEEGELAVDVYQTHKELVIQATLAGVRPEALEVSYEDDLITISGVRVNPNDEEEKSYYHQECFWGPFSREIILPEEVDITRAEATMKDGIFTLRIPITERQKAKKIQVKKGVI